MTLKLGNKTITLKTIGSKFTIVKMKPDSSSLFFTVSVHANDQAMGEALGSGLYAKGSYAYISAVAYAGYKFLHWSDGSTEPSRMVLVEDDIELIAYFEANSETGILTYIPNLTYVDWNSIGVLTYIPNQTYVDWNAASKNGKVFIYNSLYESF